MFRFSRLSLVLLRNAANWCHADHFSGGIGFTTLEATGGLKLLVKYAEKMLRKHPNHIVYLGPLCTYSLTVLVGTGHSVYPLLPVIYDVAYKKSAFDLNGRWRLRQWRHKWVLQLAPSLLLLRYLWLPLLTIIWISVYTMC
ncbi:anaerobic C4-dicarboxylate transporter family protein [Vibrio metschnikovii]